MKERAVFIIAFLPAAGQHIPRGSGAVELVEAVPRALRGTKRHRLIVQGSGALICGEEITA